VGSRGQGTVKVGAIYPRSTSIGKYVEKGIELATDIINKPHPELGDLLLAGTGGLTGLRGAKIMVVWKDSKEDPAIGEQAARDLIKEEKVVALVGAYNSPVTDTASAVAERYGIPFLNGESVADPLTERGFKWFFRTTPVAADFAKMCADFLKEMKVNKVRVNKIAIVHDDGQYGVSVASVVAKTFKENGLNITLVIPYSGSEQAVDNDVSNAVEQLKQQTPDVVMFMSYTHEAIRFAKKMKERNYKPPMMIADEAGFSDPSFIDEVGKLVQGVLTRSSWSGGLPGSPSYLVNQMYRNKSQHDLDSVTARSMQGFFVLADAINRAAINNAGSIDSEKIQAALGETDLEPKQLIMRYDGVKFDRKGQNIKASVLLSQLQRRKNDLKHVAVWPKEKASADLLLPYKGW
jgi:branched-chain amino acid transport system substrate-binding protein